MASIAAGRPHALTPFTGQSAGSSTSLARRGDRPGPRGGCRDRARTHEGAQRLTRPSTGRANDVPCRRAARARLLPGPGKRSTHRSGTTPGRSRHARSAAGRIRRCERREVAAVRDASRLPPGAQSASRPLPTRCSCRPSASTTYRASPCTRPFVAYTCRLLANASRCASRDQATGKSPPRALVSRRRPVPFARTVMTSRLSAVVIAASAIRSSRGDQSDQPARLATVVVRPLATEATAIAS